MRDRQSFLGDADDVSKKRHKVIRCSAAFLYGNNVQNVNIHMTVIWLQLRLWCTLCKTLLCQRIVKFQDIRVCDRNAWHLRLQCVYTTFACLTVM